MPLAIARGFLLLIVLFHKNPTNSFVIEVNSAIWPNGGARRVSSTSGNNDFARHCRFAASNVCLSLYNSFHRTMIVQHLRESTFSKVIVFVCRSNFMNLCARLVSQLVTVSYTLARSSDGGETTEIAAASKLLVVSAIKTIVRMKSINNNFCFADCKYIRSRCLAFTYTVGQFSHTSGFITV